jgi:hypothetical protein
MTGVALIINRVERFGPGNEWPSFSPRGRDMLIMKPIAGAARRSAAVDRGGDRQSCDALTHPHPESRR